ncbi:uncharacterized protein LOC131673345 [Phymastichus coffea]|uniref:uncharacterized protein LOC131673345 n=1 Tax=Phymastichus coffea TaxID=108790 RepID=UPI00273B8590|nr:uncharacterized protein LOC131673345 [Phymastichus coffea]
MGGKGASKTSLSGGQQTLDGKLRSTKKVTFKEPDLDKLYYDLEGVKEENRKLREKLKAESKKTEEEKSEWKKKYKEQEENIKELIDKSKEMEAKMGNLEELILEVKNRLDAALAVETARETEMEESQYEGDPTDGSTDEDKGLTWSVKSGRSHMSRRSLASGVSATSGATSWVSNNSERFTNREVLKMKKMMYDKDKLERACNIVIKGANQHIEAIEKNENTESKGDYKGWVEKFLSFKLGTSVKAVNARVSGGKERVIIVKLENENVKKNIMRNKSKLKGTTIYIENDLTYEERKKQEEIKKMGI